MWDLLNSVWEFLIPPFDADPGKQYGWRVRVAIVTCASFSGVAALAIWGLMFHGIALSADVEQDKKTVSQQIQDLDHKLDVREAERLGGEILQLRILHCKARSDTAKQLYWQQIAPRINKYQYLTGRQYPLAACGDL